MALDIGRPYEFYMFTPHTCNLVFGPNLIFFLKNRCVELKEKTDSLTQIGARLIQTGIV